MAQSPSAARPSLMERRRRGPAGDGADLYCVPGILSDNEEEKGDMGKRESEMLMTSHCALCRMDSGSIGHLNFEKGWDLVWKSRHVITSKINSD